MANLLEETLQVLYANGKTESDVKWVGNYHVKTTWEEFKNLAKDATYFNGLPHHVVAADLLIVGDNWWLERESSRLKYKYWAFKQVPREPIYNVKLVALTTEQMANDLTLHLDDMRLIYKFK